MCSFGGTVGKVFSPIPVDPLTTKALENAPGPVKTVANPLGPMLRRAVGEQAGTALLTGPIKTQAGQDQAKTLLGS